MENLKEAANENLNLRASLFGGIQGLSEVEEVVRQKLGSEAKLLESIGHYLHSIGGKRIRPLLSLMVGKAFGLDKPSRQLIEVSAGIELIHMATLLHDDIIDKSALRRHKQSPFFKFGLESTLLAGDFLLVRAFGLCAHLDIFLIEQTEKACISLTEGEILETPLDKETHSLQSSINIARKKTAALFRLAALSGAHLAECSSSVTEHLGSFGENLGIAFQMLDDILDVISEETLLGKPSGTDLRERKPSVVNILWLQSDSALSKGLLHRAENEAKEGEFVKLALEALRGKENRIVGEAKRLAREFAEKARSDLMQGAKLNGIGGDALFGLNSLIDFTLQRMS